MRRLGWIDAAVLAGPRRLGGAFVRRLGWIDAAVLTATLDPNVDDLKGAR